MKTSSVERRWSRPLIWLVGAIALIAAGCANSEAAARKKKALTVSPAPQEKPVRLRYYGGPKSPRYPE
jgi:hypothetical protein